MERRQLRRITAQQMEAHILAFNFDLGPSATAEDRAEANRQKAYVLEPLLKKLRRAQGHGKQTGKIVLDLADYSKISNIPTPAEVINGSDEGATAEAFLEESMSGN
jgi:hypothetical protein